MCELLLSLCIPTNGMTKWVIPVLDSIFSQGCEDKLFEVVISDNGDNSDLEAALKPYQLQHNNIRYSKSTSVGFMNQLDVFAAAKGTFLKFLNHRSILQKGTLEYLLDFVRRNCASKPIVYFSNGTLDIDGVKVYKSFSDFMCGLTYYASWTTGLGFWKDDFESMEIDSYDELHPHMAWLCYYTERKNYIIDNNRLLCDITYAHNEKGKYNLFKAFAVDYVAILQNLWDKGKISEKCFQFCKDDLEQFLVIYYYKFIVCKEPCSYDLSDYVVHLNVFYDIEKINDKALEMLRQSFVISKWEQIFDKTKQIFDKLKEVSETRRLYIYGAGSGGRSLHARLSSLGIHVTGFIDKNAHGIKEYCGLPVFDTTAIKISDYHIISVMNNFDNVERYVAQFGLNRDNSCFFFKEIAAL